MANRIGVQAFAGTALTSIDLSDCVSGLSIGNSAFVNCDLKSMVLGAEPPTLEDNVFHNTNSNPTVQPEHIYVPSGSVDAYGEAKGWSSFTGKISAIPFTIDTTITTFDEVDAGYTTAPDALSFAAVGDSVNAAVTIDNDSFSLSKTALSEDDPSFTVSANTGLSAGTHKAWVTVADKTEGSTFSRTFTVSLTVKGQTVTPPTSPWRPSTSAPLRWAPSRRHRVSSSPTPAPPRR